MLKEIILSNDSCEDKCIKILDKLENGDFLDILLKPENFINDLLPFCIRVLKSYTSILEDDNSDLNNCRTLVLKILNRIQLDNVILDEIIELLNIALEKDNISNIILIIRFFGSNIRCINFNEQVLENHLSIILYLVNSLFNRLETFDIDIISNCLRCLTELFIYLFELNNNYSSASNRIDIIIFRCVNFYISYLDKRNVMELIGFNKDITILLISSITKLIKLIANTIIFISKNENFSILILELVKFAAFYCPIDAEGLKLELLRSFFKIILKSREVFISKIQEFFDLRFFYSPETHNVNIKGLIGLTDTLLAFNDNFFARTFYDLFYRTEEILYTSISSIKLYLETNKNILADSNLLNNVDVNFLFLNKDAESNICIRFHLEIVKEVLNCINKQMFCVFNSRIQRFEQVDLFYRAFVSVIKVINLIEKVKRDNNYNSLCKEIFIISGIFFRDLTSKMTEFFRLNLESLVLSVFKREDFFWLFGAALKLILDLEIEDDELYLIDDFFSVFFIPVEYLLNDLNNNFSRQIVLYACERICFFEIVKKMCSETINQYFGFRKYIELLKDLLTCDFIDVNWKNYRNFLTTDDEKLLEMRSKRLNNNCNYYNLYFTIIMNRFCINPFGVSHNEFSSLMECLDILVKSDETGLHEILLLCFESFNNIKEYENNLQMHFFKNFKNYAERFNFLYQKHKNVLYLNLVFSIPIQLNIIIDDWEVLIQPIIDCLKSNNNIGIKALGYLHYLIDNSKQDFFKNKNNSMFIEMFKEIRLALTNPKFGTHAAQIFGRLKSFHKVYLYNDILFEDRSFLKNQMYAKTMSNSYLRYDTDKTNFDTGSLLLSVNDLYIRILSYFRGDYTYSGSTRILNNNHLVSFKLFKGKELNNDRQTEAAFELLAGILYSILGFADFAKHKISDRMLTWWGELHKTSKFILEDLPETNDDLFLSDINNSSYFHQLKKSQYIYDAIQALYACENTIVETKALTLLKCISEVVINYWVSRRLKFATDQLRIYFNHLTLCKAYLEGFEFSENNMPTIMLHDILTRSIKMAGSIENFLKLGILQFFYKQLSNLCNSSNVRKIKAGCYGICGLLVWDELPFFWIQKELFSIISNILLYIQHSDGIFENIVATISFLWDILVLMDIDNCAKILSTAFINCLLSKNYHERGFSKKCLALFKRKFDYKNVFATHYETVVSFLKDNSIRNDSQSLFIRIDVFIFIIKIFPRFLSKTEIKAFVKFYFYYLKKLGFLVIPPNPFFETDVKKIYADKVLRSQATILNSPDFIFEIYYQNERNKNYNRYLKYEILFLYLAYCSNKNNAKLAFDVIFYTLPSGYIFPFKRFEKINFNLIEDILKIKYEECISELLTVNTIKKMICIFLLLNNFTDERLVAFIQKIFLEFRNHIELSLIADSENNSILVKTFELSLMYPHQELLYDKIILMIYTLLYDFSKSYVAKIEDRMLNYLEKYFNYTYPFIILNITNLSILELAKKLFCRSHSFKNFVCNLGVSSKRLGLTNCNSIEEDEIYTIIKTLDFKNNDDLFKGINLLNFLRLIKYSVTESQIQLALLIHAELKKKNKTSSDLTEYFYYSINYFSADDFEVLFKIDPMFRIYNSIKVKTFTHLKNKSIMACLLKSISRSEVENYDKLIDYFGEHSWMLIELFVQEGVNSPSMIEYCKNNISNLNIRSYILFYLSTYEPLPKYFDLLLNLSFEERKYTLQSLIKIVEKFNQFEKEILDYLKKDSNYLANVFILYPLLVQKPELLTLKICQELLLVMRRFFHTNTKFYYTLGASLFKTICDFYIKNSYNIFENETLVDCYTFIFIVYLDCAKTKSLVRKFLSDVIGEYDFTINFSILNLANADSKKLFLFLDSEITKEHSNSNKNRKYLRNFVDICFIAKKDDLPNLILTRKMFELLDDYKLDENKIYLKQTVMSFIEYLLDSKQSLNEYEELIFKAFKDELVKQPLTPSLTSKDNRSALFNRNIADKKSDYMFNKILELVLKKITVQDNLPFLFKLLEMYRNNDLNLSESILTILHSEVSYNDIITFFSIIFNKQKDGIFLISKKDLLRCALNFFNSNNNSKSQNLSSLTEIFFAGLVNEDEDLRRMYFQEFNKMMIKNVNTRFIELLNLDWTLVDESYIPYIFNRMLLYCLNDVGITSFRLFDLGICKAAFFYNSADKQVQFDFHEGVFERYIKEIIDNFQDFIRKYAPSEFKEHLMSFNYYSYDASINLMESIIMELNILTNLDDIAMKIFNLVSSLKFSEKISLIFLKLLDKNKYLDSSENFEKVRKFLRNGPDCWSYLANHHTIKSYFDMKWKDYYYGSIRIYSKLPETSGATILHQLGNIKEAQQEYEKIQTKAIESKISFFEDEFDLILDGWIECAKELQQWDLTQHIGKEKKDNLLIADSIFYLKNFNLQTEREAFIQLIIQHKKEKVLDIDWLFYELFVVLYNKFDVDKAIALIKEINKKIVFGPNVIWYDNFYLVFLQVIFEMHDVSFIFNNTLESTEKINSILYRWEERDLDFENDFINLLRFSAWRKHAYRKIEDFSNELKFNDLSIKDVDICGIVNKNKEYTESIKQLKKEMYFKGNNGLGKYSNYLGFASFRNRFYDNALFSFKSVFDLPSIKVIDAYHKVVNELLCFYEMKEYKIGYDMANTTNISHFLDDQSSNLFRIRGMFSEKLGLYEDAEKLYFKAIHLSNIGVNYYCYVKLLLKKPYIKLGNFNNDSSSPLKFLDEEIIFSILMGLSCSDQEKSYNLMLCFIYYVGTKDINIDMEVYKNLIENCNVNSFVFFISKIIDLLATNNYFLVDPIIKKICKVYLHPLFRPLYIFLEKYSKDSDKTIYNRGQKLLNELSSISKIDDMISTLLRLNNIFDSVASKSEYVFLRNIEDLIADIISFSFSPVELRKKLNLLFSSPVITEQKHNIKPFLYALDSYKDDIILCPYKILDILLLIKQKMYLLLLESEIFSNIEYGILQNELIQFKNIKNYILGSYNEIRNDYKNIVSVEVVMSTLGKCSFKNDKIEDICFIGSDGKMYKYEYYKIRQKKTNMSFLYNLIKKRLSEKHELKIRNVELSLFKDSQLKNDIFVNLVEYTYIDFDFIYDEYRMSNNLPHAFCDYMSEIEIYKHEHTFKTEELDTNINKTGEVDIDIKDKTEEVDINLKDKYKYTANSIILNIDKEEIIDVLNPNINNVELEKFLNNSREYFNIQNNTYKICDFVPKLSSKDKLRTFINILKNNMKEDILTNYFKSNFESPYKYLLFKNNMLSTYSIHFAISYILYTIHLKPDNLMIYIDKGTYFKKKIFNVDFMNENSNFKNYISPNMQCLFGKEGIEGPFLSIFYHSAKDMEEFIEDAFKVFKNDEVVIKKVKERIQNLQNPDNIIKLINEFTDLENMSKIGVEEFAWL